MNKNTKAKSITYATFWERLHAFMLDNIFFLPISSLNIYNLIIWKSFELAILSIVLWVIYKPLMEWKYGATFGKKIVGIEVVDSENQRISFNQVMLRFTPYFAFSIDHFFEYQKLFAIPKMAEVSTAIELTRLQAENPSNISPLVTFFFIFSISSIFFSPQKQAQHDILAKTYCIKK